MVYGASGYTGRLVCEYLREYGIPFIAAGRSADKIHAAMKSNVAGIETASYDVVEVKHTTEALTQLFKGASVVLNTVGPFAKFGHEVVQACLAAKCHYTDTTGEQDWLITLDQEYGGRFAAAGLLLSPGLAQMYTTGEIAAQLCLETPGLDTLDIAVFWGGSPTIASTQTILVNAAMAKAYYLEQNQYVEHQPDAGLYNLTIPGQHEAALALPWGGTSHPVWFKRDPRVANVKVLGGVFNKPLMLGVPQIVGAALKATEGMNPEDRYVALAKTAATRDEHHAAAREPAHQQVGRFGARVGPAGARALRHLRQLQLQADRPAAGLCRRVVAAADAQASGLCIGLPGLRPPRVAGHLAQLRARAGARADRAPLTGPHPCA